MYRGLCCGTRRRMIYNRKRIYSIVPSNVATYRNFLTSTTRSSLSSIMRSSSQAPSPMNVANTAPLTSPLMLLRYFATHPSDARTLLEMKRRVDEAPNDPEVVFRFYEGLNLVSMPHLVCQYHEKGAYASNTQIQEQYDIARARMQNDRQAYYDHPTAEENHIRRLVNSVVERAQANTNTDRGGNITINMLASEDKSSYVWKLVNIAISLAFLGLLYMSLVGVRSGGGLLGLDGDKEIQKKTNKTFKDVIGCDEARSELQELIQFLQDPLEFSSLGGKLPKGVLLIGPPGTGKTLLAKAVAGEADVPFFSMSGSEFEEMFVGVGAKRVRELFASARKKAPCVIFIDEIDSVGSKRKNVIGSGSIRGTVNQLLAEMDGFTETEGIVVIAATNCPEELDAALIRPGRFDKKVVVPPPDVRGREELFEHYLGTVKHSDEIDPKRLARATTGATGAIIHQIVNEAAVRAALLKKNETDWDDLEWATDKVLIGAERKLVMDDAEKLKTAYHEGGHTLVGLFTPAAQPLHKVTILPRGQALGITFTLPEKDIYSMSREQLLAHMDVCMGGRVAEELKFGPGKVTTGASNDFEQANQLARGMVSKYGMNDAVGLLVWTNDQSLSQASSETRALVEEETKRLLNESYARVTKLLKTHMTDLDMLANGLVKEETMTAERVSELLKLKKQARSSR